MNPITRTVATLAAGVLGVGALAVGSTATADESDPTAKREENVSVVLTADDDDDGDTSTREHRWHWYGQRQPRRIRCQPGRHRQPLQQREPGPRPEPW